jgi:predicted permease
MGWVGGLFSRRRRYEELSESMREHLDERVEDLVEGGMARTDAEFAAKREFGNVTRIEERSREVWQWPRMESVWADVRFALRQMRKAPGFAAVVVVTLALGIGANVVVFGVVNAVLLQPLAVRDPASLVQIRHKAWASGRLLTTSYPAYEDFVRRNATFSGLAGVDAYSGGALRWRNATVEVHGDEVTGNYFDVLGVQPALGQFFHEADGHGPGSAPYVVLSDALWRRAFNADRGVVGTTVELNGHPFTVVGVATAEFHGTERFVWPDYWLPMVNEEQVSGSDYLHDRTAIAVTVIGRLKPGVTAQAATENLNAIAAELGREHPETDEGGALRLIHPGLLGDDGEVIRGFLWSVTALALLVLAAAWANLGSLFAARAADRSRELALRVALGSSRRRLLRQLLTEAMLVAAMGGAAGLATACLLLVALDRWHSPYGHMAVSVDARVYFAGVALTLGSTLLFGMVPARQAWTSSPLEMMKRGGAEATRWRRFALRDWLLGAQIAICTLLVTASLVAVRGMERALHAPLGFEPRSAMLADVDWSHAGLSGDAAIEKTKRLLLAARSVPGVTAAGTVSRTPMTGGMHGVPIFRPGTTEFTLKNSVLAPYVFTMSPGYLETAKTRLLDGRDVSWVDTAKTPYVAVVNETFARKMWGETPAIGQRFVMWGKLTEVVGVTEDGKYHDMQESAQPVAYVPASQNEQDETILVVRSPRSPREMAAALEHALSGVEPDVPITVESWFDSLESVFFPARAATVALGVMGLLAAMLAVTGIFGMAAYSVSKRTKELGIRVALGARRAQVMSAAVGRPVALLGVGSVAGLVAGMLASRLLGQIVYQANPRDPVVLGGAVLTMALLGAAAAWIPAQRALRVDPSRLLREE